MFWVEEDAQKKSLISSLPDYPASSSKPQTPAPRSATSGASSTRLQPAQGVAGGIYTCLGPTEPGCQDPLYWRGCAPVISEQRACW